MSSLPSVCYNSTCLRGRCGNTAKFAESHLLSRPLSRVEERAATTDSSLQWTELPEEGSGGLSESEDILDPTKKPVTLSRTFRNLKIESLGGESITVSKASSKSHNKDTTASVCLILWR